ncbi:MAG TPA: hypothetical protein PKL09_01935 [bacterium]|nr:hypothetical protein [bacterium]HNS34071.1 hypothetical protein [bacterium]HNW09039.1 hypothetical protein [bacterium]HPN81074.1 hypothetical protein [bacterium]HPW39180.1 hypothetical protein [bacterium]
MELEKSIIRKLALKTGYLPSCQKLERRQSLVGLNINLFDLVAMAIKIAEELELDPGLVNNADWDRAPLETIGDFIKLMEGCLTAPARN